MPFSAYLRACAVLARASVELAIRAFVAPGQPATICRRSGRVKPA